MKEILTESQKKEIELSLKRFFVSCLRKENRSEINSFESEPYWRKGNRRINESKNVY